MSKKPVLIELDDTPGPSVSEAPPVPDSQAPLLEPRAMQTVAAVTTRRPSKLTRLFWSLGSILFLAILSSAAWNFVTGWIETQPVLGWVIAALFSAFGLVLAVIGLRELASLSRLKGLDDLRHMAAQAVEQSDFDRARTVATRLARLYRDREDIRWHLQRFSDLRQDQLDAQGLMALAERELMGPLDAAAEREVEAAARQVATVTALVPLALADVIAALVANLRMIRRIAEIYGGRAGTLGAWRLTRAVMGHLVATGAVAVGDDMLEPLLGGSLLGKLSRRFGEGLVNGALTARVGLAAIEVCRPLPFNVTEAPRARDLIKGALSGLVSRGN